MSNESKKDTAKRKPIVRFVFLALLIPLYQALVMLSPLLNLSIGESSLVILGTVVFYLTKRMTANTMHPFTMELILSGIHVLLVGVAIICALMAEGLEMLVIRLDMALGLLVVGVVMALVTLLEHLVIKPYLAKRNERNPLADTSVSRNDSSSAKGILVSVLTGVCVVACYQLVYVGTILSEVHIVNARSELIMVTLLWSLFFCLFCTVYDWARKYSKNAVVLRITMLLGMVIACVVWALIEGGIHWEAKPSEEMCWNHICITFPLVLIDLIYLVVSAVKKKMIKWAMTVAREEPVSD